MCGSRAIGIARVNSGLGPPVAGNNPPNGVLAGSGLSTGAKEALTATNQVVGPTNGWKKGRTTAAGGMSTAEGTINIGAIARIMTMAGAMIETMGGTTTAGITDS